MNEKIPFDDNNDFGGTGNNDQVSLLIMHKAWKEVFGKENENEENMHETEKGRE